MNTCVNCHTSNDDAAQYCDECGAPLAAASSSTNSKPAPNAQDDPDANGGGRAMPFTLITTPRVSSSTVPTAVASSSDAMLHEEADEANRGVGGDGRRDERQASGAVVRMMEKSPSSRSSQHSSAPAADVSTTFEAQPSHAKPPHAKLVIERGRSAGKGFFINEAEAHIGRWDADGGIFPDVDLDADDPEAKVSRRHARILRRGEVYYIEDLGSTNGTFVNRGRRLLPGALQPLRDEDEIIVGKTFLRLHIIK